MSCKIFISHASEDKEELARPLAYYLMSEGYQVWYDEFELKVGDSLTENIDKGLSECDFAIVILSPNFFSKKWPKRELAGLAAKELITGAKVLLPIWHNISAKEILNYSPPLADKLAVSSSLGIEVVVAAIKNTIKTDLKAKVTSNEFSYTITYKSVHFLIDLTHDKSGNIAKAKKTNWLFTKASNINVIRDGGIAGKSENFKSNLGNVNFLKEGGTYVAYTNLYSPLVPDKIYEHSLEYTCLESFLDSKEHIGINVSRDLEECGSHVFFPIERKPKNIVGKLIYNSEIIYLAPVVSKNECYISLVAKNPPPGSRLVLEWEW